MLVDIFVKDLLPAIRSLLKVCEGVRFTAITSDMEPLVRKGIDKIELVYSDGRDLDIGDIVMLEPAEGIFVLRRVYRKTDLGYVTKGDAYKRTDGIVFPNMWLEWCQRYTEERKRCMQKKYAKDSRFLFGVRLYH